MPFRPKWVVGILLLILFPVVDVDFFEVFDDKSSVFSRRTQEHK